MPKITFEVSNSAVDTSKKKGNDMGEHSYKDHGCQQSEHYCSCGEKVHHPHGEEGCCCTDKFFEIANEAWAEVLKEKIKDKILARKRWTYGQISRAYCSD